MNPGKVIISGQCRLTILTLMISVVTLTGFKSVNYQLNPVRQSDPMTLVERNDDMAEPFIEQLSATISIDAKEQDTIPEKIDLILSEALEYQYKADSLSKVAEEWKKNPDKLDNGSKTGLWARIAENDRLAASYQQKANQKYDEAHASMNSDSFSPVKVNVKEQRTDIETVRKTYQQPSPQNKGAAVKGDSVQNNSAQNYTIFEVKSIESVSGKQIPLNAEIPPGLIYRIQVAVFRNPVALSYFKGLTPVYGFRAAGAESTAYYAGMFRRIADARKALVTVRQKGFRDAFIVAVSGGKQISIERAAVLEKEWGKKPFISVQSPKQPVVDTIPPELFFRVEVLRSPKPVKPEAVEEMEKIAGAKGLDMETQEKGTIVYLIGKFITYESASQYADLLVRNGYREAKVVARLGKNEVPVEIAKQLFEKVDKEEN